MDYVAIPAYEIALINGAQMMSCVGAEAVERALGVARQADVIAALTLEALRGTTKAFHSGTLKSSWSLPICAASQLIHTQSMN